MSFRDIDPTAGLELQKPFKAHVLGVRIDFASGPVTLVEGSAPVSWDSGAGLEVYKATHDVGTVSAAHEHIDIATRELALSLNGLEAQYQGLLADPTEYSWREVIVWRFMLSPVTWQLVGDAILVWRGRADRSSSVKDGDRVRVTLNCTNRLADAERRSDRRYTGESHRADFPGDGLFDHVDELLDQELNWGGQPVSGGAISGGSDRPVEALP